MELTMNSKTPESLKHYDLLINVIGSFISEELWKKYDPQAGPLDNYLTTQAIWQWFADKRQEKRHAHVNLAVHSGQKVHSGKIQASPSAAMEAAETLEMFCAKFDLDDDEREILMFDMGIGQFATSDELANRLGIKVKTLFVRRYRLYEKIRNGVDL
jgi:hypothetical protein